MTNKEQQIKNSFIYLLPMVIGCILPFITLPIFTRILTKEDYGVLALAQVYAIFVSGLANFGMTAAYDRNYFQYRGDLQESAQLLYSIVLFVVVNFLVLAVLTYLFRRTLAEFIIGSAEHEKILFWAFCAQFFTGGSYYYLAFFKNSEIAKDFVKYTIVAAFINLIISLFLVAYLRIGVIGLIYAQLCSGFTVFCLLTYRFVEYLPPSLSKSKLKEALQIAYPLTPRIFLGVIGKQFDKYMIGLLASVGGVGIYSIGQRISYIIFNYMTAIQNVFTPQVYKRMFDLDERGGESIGKYLTPFAYVCIFPALLVSLFSEELISILTPPSFHGTINIVAVLAMYYGFLYLGILAGNQLIFMKKTHVTSVLTMVSIGINVGLNIPFIMRWGAIGAAWATVLAGLISGTISFFVAQHYYEIKWEYEKLGYLYFVFFGFSILIILLRSYNLPYEIILIVKLVAVSIYTFIGVAVRVITIKNYIVLKNMFFNLRQKSYVPRN